MKTITSLLAGCMALLASANLNAQTCCSALAGPDKVICCTGSGGVTIGATPAATASGGGCDSVIYRWIPPTGLSCTNCPNPTASPSTTTNYTLTIIYFNKTTHDTCCKNSDIVKVTVNSTCCRSSGPVSKQKEYGINVYPVPASQIITVEAESPLTAGELCIYDANNKLVWTQKENGNKLTADLKMLVKGVYFVVVKENNEVIHTQKLILQE